LSALAPPRGAADPPSSRGTPFDEEGLLEEARRRTGLREFGGSGFLAGLRVLLRSLRDEAFLHASGEAAVREDLLRLLGNRLQMAAVFEAHPEITARRVQRPLFVVGLPRTGSSILHELLAQDPGNRAPMTWEVKHPCPPPELATFHSDPRIAAVDAELAQMDGLIPEFKKMHPQAAELPQECLNMTTHEFASSFFSVSYRVPGYQAWLDAADAAPVYAAHHRQLQLLHWRCGPSRWVLKSSSHLWSLGALRAEYPDACIVQTHRDPLKVLASFTSLVTTLRRLYSDRVDAREIAEQQAAFLANGLGRAMAFRDGANLPPEQVIDLHFAAFIRDPVGEIAGIYRHFGRELSAEAAQRMRAFLAENPGDKHGAHRYRFADTALDLATERRRFHAYQERFGIASEAVL
jgi:hypothetical protein